MLKEMMLLLILGLISSCQGDDSVRVRTPHGQSLTSSTLQWVDLKAGQDPPENALRVTKDGPFWCRAEDRGTTTSGGIGDDGNCHIPFLGKPIIASKYEVLVSINGSARIVEKKWDRLLALPDHSIETPDMILAYIVTDEGEIHPGYVSPHERRAYFLKGNKVERLGNAIILTEDEPENYIVKQVLRNEAKMVLTKEEVEVARTVLTNSDKTVQLTTDNLDYTAIEKLYWGQVRGTINGLDATVIDPAGVQRDITWGIENELDHLETQLVEYELPGEASVDVILIAVMHKLEGPYSAMLVSNYADGITRQHPIAGLNIHIHMAELRADFSQPYFTQNKSDIVGEYMTSHILIHSTTTTTTTTTTTVFPDTKTTSEDNSIHSHSLATSSEGGHTQPIAEAVNDGANSLMISLLLPLLGLFLIKYQNNVY